MLRSRRSELHGRFRQELSEEAQPQGELVPSAPRRLRVESSQVAPTQPPRFVRRRRVRSGQVNARFNVNSNLKF